MKILYCHDNFYMPSPDGTIYSAGQFQYAYYKPFLEAFDEVEVVGRIEEYAEDKDITAMNISSGPHVEFTLLPNINSPKGLIKNYRYVRAELEKSVKRCDGVIIRAVSDMGWVVFQLARSMNKPIAMEMAACAWDSTWNHGSRYAKIYAPVRYIRDKIITRWSDYVMYVSHEFLPNRYPTNGTTEFASNVRIERSENDVLEKRLEKIKHCNEAHNPIVIGLIGTLNHKLKGVHDAIEALHLLKKNCNKNFEFRILGPGNKAPYLDLADKYGVYDLVHFDGIVKSGDKVLEWLDNIDIYIQPSYQEGVPRATIEAMSRGAPVIGSTAGGIPELLPAHWLHKPGDVRQLAALIQKMAEDPVSQISNANRNFEKSFHYSSEVLMPKRLAFWKAFAEFVQRKSGQSNVHPFPSKAA